MTSYQPLCRHFAGREPFGTNENNAFVVHATVTFAGKAWREALVVSAFDDSVQRDVEVYIEALDKEPVQVGARQSGRSRSRGMAPGLAWLGRAVTALRIRHGWSL